MLCQPPVGSRRREDLPYKDDVFETCLVVAALDHCADPKKVLGEGHRCLAPGGSLLVLQDCGSHEAEHEPPPRTPSLRERVRPILRFLRTLSGRPTAAAYHMHHFEVPGLLAVLESLGYRDVRVSSAPVLRGLFAFEARKSRD